ncbi:hypothetical protein BWR12_13890, partial [Citrobacter braakii]
GSFEAKLGAKIASVTSGHNVTCFYCEVMISPLFRWPNSVCHYIHTKAEFFSDTDIRVRSRGYNDILT